MATTVKLRKSDLITTDGPFAETKEQCGGDYVLDVADLDQAIHWASKIPSTTRIASTRVGPWSRVVR